MNNGVIKFYMNNPCVIIREIEEFCEIKLNPKFAIEFDGSDWCTGCQAGHTDGTPNHHTCDEYQEVIDVINDEQAAILVLVEKRLLHDSPVEEKRFREAEERIAVIKETHQEYHSEIMILRGQRTKITIDIEEARKRLDRINREVEEKEKQLLILENEVNEEIEKVRSYNASCPSSHDLPYLYERDFILCSLENGGVDNWEWYGESYPDESDIRKYVAEKVLDKGK